MIYDIDVRATGVDALCCSSYKWLMAEFGVAHFSSAGMWSKKFNPTAWESFR